MKYQIQEIEMANYKVAIKIEMTKYEAAIKKNKEENCRTCFKKRPLLITK